MRKINKNKLSKKTKKQIIRYLSIMRSYYLEEYYSTSLGDSYKEYLHKKIGFLSSLMLDIEFYGVK